jgi:hypothetical protein
MLNNEKSPASAAAAADPGRGDKTDVPTERSATSRAVQPPRKWARILRALLDGRRLNRFEAARELRDWCLNTTVSQLERRGLTIQRKDEVVPGAYGPVHCCRYWLAPESSERARELLQEKAAA